MKKEEYIKQISKISELTIKKLGLLQEELTQEEIIGYTPFINFFYINLIESAVGKEDLIPYMIILLNQAQNYINDKDKQADRQVKRFKEIKKSNKEYFGENE